MKREDLLSPEKYNIIQEMERFSLDPQKLAIKWEDEQGDTKEITYKN